MISDSIVEEVRAIRDEIAQECNYDIDAIFEALRHLAATSSAEHVSLSPRRINEADQQGSALTSGAASP